ncbi:arabinogalactan endo-1,4-beta-galactosidase [Antribacter sp. KLBMP9083]|uniref:Arabinogalactan endo-beta-1,4-galactanase n=1 Tax=Antribacter soli TaxID=2910976 RepID=A0AA41QJN3_9MICO|nr:glycosyl hydrolase 53 family protein [Antribacter soli]MCF4123477.1 arabinogalactan endo-1,4-beta-galactosidase [Antribacter soli]
MFHRARIRARVAVAALAAAAAAVVAPAAALVPAQAKAPAAAATLVNPGFESGLAGWTVKSTTGDRSAAKAEAGGAVAWAASGAGNHLTHWADHAYQVTTGDGVSGLTQGWWTASAWVKAGGGLAATRLTLTGCGGGADGSVVVPSTEQDDAWVQVSVSAYVADGSCTIGVATAGTAGAWVNVDDVTLVPGRVTREMRGGDLSGLAKNEDFGATYAASNGTPGDAVELLADAGMNVGRLKVWVDPADGYNEVTHVVESARRIEAAGMDLMVDFHYSDRWTDPGAQGVPAAWAGSTVEELAQHVHDHTAEVMQALTAAGVNAEYVQVGNEINPGMLWPYGQTWDVVPGDGVDGAQWDSLALFLTAGHDAVKEVSPGTQTILHLTNINNGIGSLTWWFDEVTARDVPFDLIGLSYYGYWHGSLADLQEAVSTLSARYDRDVVVVETAYPFTLTDDTPAWENVINLPSELVAGYPATPQGQAAAFRAVQDVVAAAPGGRGLGTMYWEPAWTSVAGNGWDPADPSSGNAWENQAMFDFSGRLLAPVAATLAP